jgi:hypothetical protein
LANPEPVYAPAPGFTPPTNVDRSYGDRAYFDAAPGFGDFSDGYGALTGRTLFTGEELSTGDRLWAAVFTLAPVATSGGFRQIRKFISGIDTLIPGTSTVHRRITGKLTREISDDLRTEARNIYYHSNPNLIGKNLQVHHIIPLEWAHLFPDADPNRLSNIIGLDGPTHRRINARWTNFRNYYNQLGRSPTEHEVLDFVDGLDYGP